MRELAAKETVVLGSMFIEQRLEPRQVCDLFVVAGDAADVWVWRGAQAAVLRHEGLRQRQPGAKKHDLMHPNPGVGVWCP